MVPTHQAFLVSIYNWVAPSIQFCLFMGTQHVFLRIRCKAVRCEFDSKGLGKNYQTPARCFHIRRLSKVDSLTALDVSALCIEKSSGGRWMKCHLGSSEKDQKLGFDPLQVANHTVATCQQPTDFDWLFFRTRKRSKRFNWPTYFSRIVPCFRGCYDVIIKLASNWWNLWQHQVISITHRIHGIYANIKGVHWWDPWSTIYSIHGSYGLWELLLSGNLT